MPLAFADGGWTRRGVFSELFLPFERARQGIELDGNLYVILFIIYLFFCFISVLFFYFILLFYSILFYSSYSFRVQYPSTQAPQLLPLHHLHQHQKERQATTQKKKKSANRFTRSSVLLHTTKHHPQNLLSCLLYVLVTHASPLTLLCRRLPFYSSSFCRQPRHCSPSHCSASPIVPLPVLGALLY
jgi:hypothetical protein